MCWVHFIFQVTDSHLAAINEALITLLTTVMVLLILGVVLSSGGAPVSQKTKISRFHKSDLSPSWKVRRMWIGKMSSRRVNLILRKHLLKLVYYLKACEA